MESKSCTGSVPNEFPYSKYQLRTFVCVLTSLVELKKLYRPCILRGILVRVSYAFHLLCGECTITLEDITLRLDLLVDGAVVMGVVGVGDWSSICEQLLDQASDKFRGSRVEMKLLKGNFNYIDNLASDVERQQYVQAFIMKWNNEVSQVGITEELKDIRLLLDQRSIAEFGFRQNIPSSLKELKELHKIDLWRRTDKDWLKFHTKYIYIW
ncbi:hypothetical protein Golob_005879 [Gossypium lobatum]|uniref:Aminotransferase-like plant mobile domain-containing protein n=1 Tax=Gossypium lobatum TaxID=34289 RepID=A0A7J8MUZ4_9ROSI|nr:hypothetical protein [Gossypium lobatum]